MKGRNNQQGFTIIELVVVILLLGILTATALPRFMDVTDEAHQAVVDGLEGGLQTGIALFHAQWVAEGGPTTVAVSGFGEGTLYANAEGYPIGSDATFSTSADCLAVYNGVMQQGGLPVGAATANNADDETAVETGTTANPGADIIAMANDATTPTGCKFFYVSQYKNGTSTADHTIRSLVYSATAGTITEDSVDLDSD